MSEKNGVLAERYRLDSRIAAGGVGEVWRAQDLVLGRTVAVKRLRAEYAEHPETLARFRSEARHAAAVSHPGIAQVYDYGESGIPDQPFLVMELIDGPSLAEIIARGPLPPERVMDIVAQAAAGLGAAHRAGLVHRDIKPANLLIAPGGRVKITDFGIAHAAGSAPLTRQGSLVGTPAYLAPERVAGHRASPASDLYSLGILAHECLTGARPYAGTPIETALAHGHRELPPLPPSVPPAVAALVAELAAKDPAARPATAEVAANRAAQLRDSLAAIPAGVGSSAGLGLTMPLGNPATLADQNPMTMADLGPFPRPSPVGGQWPAAPGRSRAPWRGRRVAAAVIISSVIAGVIGWLASGALSGQAAGNNRTTTPPSSASSAQTVAVRASALIGLPAHAVVKQLRSLGLRPVVKFVQPTDHSQEPGTVAAIQPAGRVPAGSPITVDVVAGHGHGHDHGHGGGDGNGQGNGN